MAKLSVLDMVQDILSAMDSDEVNSITDTVESTQVAAIVKNTFNEMMASRDWPFLRTESALEGLGDTDYPTKMMMPDGLNKINYVKYNKKDVEYLPPKLFKDMLDNREEGDNITASGFITDRDPLYWTSYDDKYVWFDSYDSDVDNTLQGSKSWLVGVVVPNWEHVDSFTPDLPEKVFPTLLAEAKASCFYTLKQMPHQREEIKARRGRVALQNEAWRNEQGEVKSNTNINYGRK